MVDRPCAGPLACESKAKPARGDSGGIFGFSIHGGNLTRIHVLSLKDFHIFVDGPRRVRGRCLFRGVQRGHEDGLPLTDAVAHIF